MLSYCKTLAAVGAVLLFGAPLEAQARFGKRDSDDGSKARSSSTHSSKPAAHAAVPAGSSTPAAAPSTSTHRPRTRWRHHHHAPRVGWYHYEPAYYGWGFGYYPYFAARPPPPPPHSEPQAIAEQAPPFAATFGAGLQLHPEGGAFDLNGAFEGRRWGVNGSLTGIFARAEDGSNAFDGISLFDAHLTYALLAGRSGRLRLEGGVAGVGAPDLTSVGPDVGFSAALGLVGPFGVEAASHLTPFRHRRLDANAGVTLALGSLGLRAGMKLLWLDDAGLLGTRHIDSFYGPYAGVGFAF